jgi:GR25 family glycosyltransferase involved in LPS biosynthesis
MNAFVIVIKNDPYSESVGRSCIETGKSHGIDVLRFDAITVNDVPRCLDELQLQWTWAGENNNTNMTCKKTGLKNFPYKTSDIRKKIACSLSHYYLWSKCVQDDEPMLILEHDSVFINDFPHNIKFNGICQINDPAGATRKGSWWSNEMKKRGTVGAHEKTWVTSLEERDIPDGLAGNSAYLIKPWAALELIDWTRVLGIWPNDAVMCKQLCPYLEEYYPFITKVQQDRSTTV